MNLNTIRFLREGFLYCLLIVIKGKSFFFILSNDSARLLRKIRKVAKKLPFS